MVKKIKINYNLRKLYGSKKLFFETFLKKSILYEKNECCTVKSITLYMILIFYIPEDYIPISHLYVFHFKTSFRSNALKTYTSIYMLDLNTVSYSLLRIHRTNFIVYWVFFFYNFLENHQFGI